MLRAYKNSDHVLVNEETNFRLKKMKGQRKEEIEYAKKDGRKKGRHLEKRRETASEMVKEDHKCQNKGGSDNSFNELISQLKLCLYIIRSYCEEHPKYRRALFQHVIFSPTG